ncbi:MAG: DNA-binding protein [Methanobacteriaceae archaeon]|jgi:DNA/RNA endonuclease YhcR with UshA esterase domain|nr:MAG: DNA-binding protein [Methanobacterium sp. BRmetb2]MCC7558494.1 DNA-binding protein [Methanobacteriaceae archaeon]
MQDDDIFKMAFITAIIGVVGMIIFSNYILPREIEIIDIDKGMLDEEVSLEGYVSKLEKSKNSNTYFLEIIDNTGKISAVIFEKTVIEIEKGNFTVKSLKNRRIKIVGTVTQYNGDMEIILKDAKSIKIIA